MKKEAHIVYLGLGSNAEDATDRLDAAVAGIAAIPGVHMDAVSPLYVTEPQDYADQPWFHNRVLRVSCDAGWEPDDLMRRLLELEAELGRVRSADPALRFGPRAIDIDVLLFDERRSDSVVCTLPHPRLERRAFWLVPLKDLTVDPVVRGRTAAELLDGLDWRLEGNAIYQ